MTHRISHQYIPTRCVVLSLNKYTATKSSQKYLFIINVLLDKAAIQTKSSNCRYPS